MTEMAVEPIPSFNGGASIWPPESADRYALRGPQVEPGASKWTEASHACRK